jgi:glycosyltransferase involved in cell wall biosynthesis
MYQFIVVGWNCQQYVKICVDSILSQKIKNFNIHLLDDKSTDNTYKELLKYKTHPNVFIYQNSENMGAAYSRYKLLTILIKLEKSQHIALFL